MSDPRLLRAATAVYPALKWAIPYKIRATASEYAARERALHALPRWSRREPDEGKVATLRIGVVGAGQYAQHHYKVLDGLRGVEIASILSTGGPKAKEIAKQYGVPQVHTDLDLFLRGDLDAYVVVVPPQYLPEIAEACLRTGRPVLMEKPAGVTSDQTRHLAEVADEAGTFGMVGVNRRFYSSVEHGLAALANSGPIRGAVLEVPEALARERASRRLSEWEVDRFMVRNSIHGLDLLRYIVGEPVRVTGMSRPRDAEGNIGASWAFAVEHATGAMSTVLALWDTPPGFRMRVIAEKGYLELDPLESGQIKLGPAPKLPVPLDEVDENFRGGLYAQALAFVEAVRKGTKPAMPASLLDDHVKTIEFVEQIRFGGKAA